MNEFVPNVLLVNGSLSEESSVEVCLRFLGGALKARGCTVESFDYSQHPLPVFHPKKACEGEVYQRLQPCVAQADVLILGTPDYHGSMSGALKNFLDHFWKEYAGKLMVSVVASYEKGLTVADQIRTVSRQCYSWTLPYAIACTEGVDVKDGVLVEGELQNRLLMAARDISVYGGLLKKQRGADLIDEGPGFMARYRK